RLQPGLLPKVFGPGGDRALDLAAVREGFAVLAAEVSGTTGVQRLPEELAIDLLEIAVRKMAQAVRRLTVGRGLDPSDFALIAFGGAAGQHACSVANELGIDTILVPPSAGLLSAIGIGMADIREVKQRSVGRPCTSETIADLNTDFDSLAAGVSRSIAGQGGLRDLVSTIRSLQVHYEGVESKIRVPFESAPPISPISPTSPNSPVSSTSSNTLASSVSDAFSISHRKRFGFDMPGRRIMIASIEVEGVGAAEAPSTPVPNTPAATTRENTSIADLGERNTWFGDRWMPTPFLDRSLLSDHPVSGPAVIIDPDTTTVVEDGWSAELTSHGAIKMTRDRTSDHASGRTSGRTSTTPQVRAVDMDPMRLEIFGNLFMHIAEQMGDQLRRTARSVNVKERLDYSCALFDRAGKLIANAPHIPVHLGAMGEAVQQVLADFGGRMAPGDAFLLNNPFRGGTHVPDLTVVSPVFIRDVTDIPGTSDISSIADISGLSNISDISDISDISEPVAFVASRAHHADIGGKSPGSMPANATGPEEEGVVFDGLQIVVGGAFQDEQIRRVLARKPHPARNPDSNIGDIQAQLAANQTGIIEFDRAVSRYGMDVVEAYMGHVRANAAETIRNILASLPDGSFSVEMDSGQRIAVAIMVDRDVRSATIDFTGTSDQAANSLNAPRAITTAAVLYVLRCLAGSNLPLNSGCLEPVNIVVPRGSMLDPIPPAAVAGGNVETSQCIVDALLGALKMQAGSQGTMNNVTFGNAEVQYYETICGGTGAGPDFDGTSAVHSHMTNSRITDPEIIEQRMPVILEEFSIRQDSGGRGRHFGGDGAVRRIRFLSSMTLSILSNRRRVPAHGIDGGGPGRPGRNVLIRADGSRLDLGPTVEVSVEPGDVLVIETPGGGGCG
ncbi:MAG: hydantoinase B/oxoprolinase family protein, partial [Rhodothermia bacterium]